MINARTLFVASLFFVAVSSTLFSQTKILVVTGGKEFERDSFYKIFESFSDIVYDTATKPAVFNDFNSDKINYYDAVVFYDAYQPINEDEKKSFLSLTEKGIGLVFLHHALVSHQDWDEYEKILGGRYHHKAYSDEGKKYGQSTYKHDQEFFINIVDKENPVTKDMTGFHITDEAYLNYNVHDYVSPLLTSDNCENGKYLGWTNSYKNSKIVYLQLGHDHQAYENTDYRMLIRNAIDWVKE
ncbi:MAG: ThuA domain-containing protein [Ignavibacteriales bacterium]|nr:MAG: ThuA domain-containing protein [Ignavibacteriales bacterium]